MNGWVGGEIKPKQIITKLATLEEAIERSREPIGYFTKSEPRLKALTQQSLSELKTPSAALQTARNPQVMVKMAAQRILEKMAEIRDKSRLPSAKTARFDGEKLQVRSIESGLATMPPLVTTYATIS